MCPGEKWNRQQSAIPWSLSGDGKRLEGPVLLSRHIEDIVDD